MALLGSLVNAVGIILGTLLGMALHKIPDKMKETVMNGMALSVIILSIQMAFKTNNSLIVILSICIGGAIGELLHLEDGLKRMGRWIEDRFSSKGDGKMAEGFVTATLIFATGAMGIIGALNGGIKGDHQVLYTKTVMDGFMSLLLGTTLGWGVMFSAIPVVVLQGAIALFATQINQLIPETLMTLLLNELTATGGIMIFAIGLNILGLTKIRVANLVPAILVVVLISWLLVQF